MEFLMTEMMKFQVTWRRSHDLDFGVSLSQISEAALEVNLSGGDQDVLALVGQMDANVGIGLEDLSLEMIGAWITI